MPPTLASIQVGAIALLAIDVIPSAMRQRSTVDPIGERIDIG